MLILPPKPPPNLHWDHVDLGNRHSQKRRGVLPHAKVTLVTGPDGDLAVAAPEHGGVLRLDVALVYGLCVELPLDHHVGVLEPLLHVAYAELSVYGDVAVLAGVLAHGHCGHLVVEYWRAVLHRLHSGHNRRKHFVFHVDEVQAPPPPREGCRRPPPLRDGPCRAPSHGP